MESEKSVMDELWETKRKLASGFDSFHDYFKHLLDEQRTRERQGVKFVSFPSRRVESELAMT